MVGKMPFCKRWSFGFRKTAFYIAICHLLQPKRISFTMPFVTYCMSVCYLFCVWTPCARLSLSDFGLVRMCSLVSVFHADVELRWGLPWCCRLRQSWADALFWAGVGFKLQYGHMLACCDVSFRFLPVGADVGFWRSVSLLLLVFYKFVSKSG